MFKQALRSGGGHLTTKHVEEVSLSALFLMEAARKTDRAFKVRSPSTTHTVRDSDRDVLKVSMHLAERKVHTFDKDRSTPAFVDPTEIGWKKVSTTTWLKDVLSRSLDLEANLEEDQNVNQEVDLYYELADVL